MELIVVVVISAGIAENSLNGVSRSLKELGTSRTHSAVIRCLTIYANLKKKS